MKQAYKLAALLVGLLLLVGFNVYYFVLREPPREPTPAPSSAPSMARRPGSNGAAASSRSKDPRSRRRGTANRGQETRVTPANAEKPGLAAAMGLGTLISSSRQEWQAAKQPVQVAEGSDSKASPKATPSVEENGQEPAPAGAKSAVVAEVVAADTLEQAAPVSKLDAFGGKEEASSDGEVLVRTPLMYAWEALYGNADLQSELEGQADSPIADRVLFTGLAMTEARGAMRAVALINGSFFRQGDEIAGGLVLQRIDPRGGKIQVSDGKELAVISLPSLFVGDSGGGGVGGGEGGGGGVNVRRGSDNEFGQGSGGGEGRGRRSSSRGGEQGGGGEGRGSRRGGSSRGERGGSSRGERGGGSEGRGSRGGSSIPSPRRGRESGGGREQSGGVR